MVSPRTDGHWKPLLQGKPGPTTLQQDRSSGPCLVADVRGIVQVGARSPLCVAIGAPACTSAARQEDRGARQAEGNLDTRFVPPLSMQAKKLLA